MRRLNSPLAGSQTAAASTYGGKNNDRVANAMRNASEINRAREEFYKSGLTSGEGAFQAMGFLNAGRDPIEQFVGSFHYQIDATQSTLQFTITNTTSVSSFTGNLLPNSLNPIGGPMGNYLQTYIFTEPRLSL